MCLSLARRIALSRHMKLKQRAEAAERRRAQAEAALGGYTEGGVPKAYLTRRGPILVTTSTPSIKTMPISGEQQFTGVLVSEYRCMLFAIVGRDVTDRQSNTILFVCIVRLSSQVPFTFHLERRKDVSMFYLL